MTTAPQGAWRRQDLHLQVQQCVSLRALPCVPWALVPPRPRDDAARRLPPDPSQVASLVARFLIPGLLPSVRGVPKGLGAWWKPPRRARALVTRCPQPGMWRGDRWLSHVPELPLCLHAPLSDPGGVLGTRHVAPRTAAFRPLETVGVFLRTTMRIIPLSTTVTPFGAQSRGLHPRYTRLRTPPCGDARGFTPDVLARRSSGGIRAVPARTH